MPEHNEIHNLVSKKIRHLVNMPRKHYVLSRDKYKFNQLCSSMDVIEDTALTIDSYCVGKYCNNDTDRWEHYIPLYGLLQALFLQQDATLNLCKSLDISMSNFNCSELLKIRTIRNKSIGHPTEKKIPNSEPVSFHFLYDVSAKKASFKLMSVDEAGKMEFEEFFVLDIVTIQKKYIIELLNIVIETLKNEEIEHRGRFQMEKLATTINVSTQKFYDSIFDKDKRVFGQIILSEVDDVLKCFQEALEARGMELKAYQGIYEIYEELHYPIEELKRFYDSVPEHINEKTAWIFAFFVRHKIDELKEYAQNIDEEYSDLSDMDMI